MKFKTYSYLVVVFILFLLSGCESIQRSISQISLQDLEGSWGGDYRVKENSHLDGLTATDTHNNALPSQSKFRVRCHVEIRALSNPIEDFSHGVFLSFGNIRAYSKEEGLITPANLLYYLVKEDAGEVFIHSLEKSVTDRTKISKRGAKIKTKFTPKSQSITIKHSRMSSPVDLGVHRHIAGQTDFEKNWNNLSVAKITLRINRSLD